MFSQIWEYIVSEKSIYTEYHFWLYWLCDLFLQYFTSLNMSLIFAANNAESHFFCGNFEMPTCHWPFPPVSFLLSKYILFTSSTVIICMHTSLAVECRHNVRSTRTHNYELAHMKQIKASRHMQLRATSPKICLQWNDHSPKITFQPSRQSGQSTAV